MPRELTVEELKQRQIDILDAIVAFCDANGIRYFLAYGTLIGAVRHKGFIPWDDDIDLEMLRDDYDRFVKEFKQQGPYKVLAEETCEDYVYPYAKVFDTATTIHEDVLVNHDWNAVFVDIFPLDHVPADATLRHKQAADTLRYRNILGYQWLASDKGMDLKKKIKYRIARAIGIKKALKKLQDACVMYNKEKCPFVSDLVSGTSTEQYVPANLYDESVKLPFEGKMYDVPAGYDEILKRYYGDYMKLPPVEQQISNHDFTAYEK